jgi:hypothetical protein
MGNTTGHSAFAGFGVPLSANNRYPPIAGSPKARLNWVSRSLWVVVVVLGATTFAVSLATPAPLDYPVRLSVLAATVAAVGLLPSQSTRGWIVVGFAVTGCLDAVAAWVKVDDAGWATTVVLALNAVQSVAAVGALLRETTTPEPGKSESVSDYSAYARLVEAYQAYASQYQQLFAAPQNAAEQAGAQAQSEAGVEARTAQDAFAALQARYARHGMGGVAQQSRGQASPPSSSRMADSGVPGVNRLAPESHPYHQRQQDSGADAIGQTGP